MKGQLEYRKQEYEKQAKALLEEIVHLKAQVVLLNHDPNSLQLVTGSTIS